MKKISLQSGFSLVETLVAITILLIVIVGPMTISTRTSQSTSFASEQVTAYLLAQEGVELAQKARDDLMLEYYDNPAVRPNPWADFINAAGGTYQRCYNSNGCGMNTTLAGELFVLPAACSGVGSCFLSYNDAAGTVRSRYNHTTGVPTDFRRRIFFSRTGDQVRVVSRVDWRTGNSSTTKAVEVETYLFNIYDN